MFLIGTQFFNLAGCHLESIFFFVKLFNLCGLCDQIGLVILICSKLDASYKGGKFI